MANIINIRNYTDALRNTGYKNVESAISEIVDNSLEASANDVLIICTLDTSSGRKVVSEIAVLDNGTGMDKKTLESCLVLGESTRKGRKGMGRFGVGLPQASLHVCPRVEVYSWQNKVEVRRVYLDINEVRTGKQKEIEGSGEGKIPAPYKKYFKDYRHIESKMNFNESGTLVIWKECDRLSPKTVAALFDRFKFLLGRKFRYFIHKRKHNIGCSVISSSKYDIFLRPNDPLCLMEDNMVLGDVKNPKEDVEQGESIFELWENGEICGTVTRAVNYFDSKSNSIKESEVKILFSWAKLEFQNAGGETKIGKHLGKNVGVSIIRANREIEFGKFDFFSDVNEPQHRWWGCEIRFTPELDEAFGVANNKQHVELFELEEVEYIEEDIKPIWFKLNKVVGVEIAQIYKKLKARKAGSRSGRNKNGLTEESIVRSVESNNKKETASMHVKNTTDIGALIKLGMERLIDGGNPNPTREEVIGIIELPVKLELKDLGDNSTFIDITNRMGNCWLTINVGSMFHRELYSKIEEADEPVKRAFNLILMAFARAEDEAYNNTPLYNAFREVRELWGLKLRKYLETDFKA